MLATAFGVAPCGRAGMITGVAHGFYTRILDGRTKHAGHTGLITALYFTNGFVA